MRLLIDVMTEYQYPHGWIVTEVVGKLTAL
jgi:hypothetical protein